MGLVYFTYIYQKDQLNVGTYTIHGSCGNILGKRFRDQTCDISYSNEEVMEFLLGGSLARNHHVKAMEFGHLEGVLQSNP